MLQRRRDSRHGSRVSEQHAIQPPCLQGRVGGLVDQVGVLPRLLRAGAPSSSITPGRLSLCQELPLSPRLAHDGHAASRRCSIRSRRRDDILAPCFETRSELGHVPRQPRLAPGCSAVHDFTRLSKAQSRRGTHRSPSQTNYAQSSHERSALAQDRPGVGQASRAAPHHCHDAASNLPAGCFPDSGAGGIDDYYDFTAGSWIYVTICYPWRSSQLHSGNRLHPPVALRQPEHGLSAASADRHACHVLRLSAIPNIGSASTCTIRSLPPTDPPGIDYECPRHWIPQRSTAEPPADGLHHAQQAPARTGEPRLCLYVVANGGALVWSRLGNAYAHCPDAHLALAQRLPAAAGQSLQAHPPRQQAALPAAVGIAGSVSPGGARAAHAHALPASWSAKRFAHGSGARVYSVQQGPAVPLATRTASAVCTLDVVAMFPLRRLVGGWEAHLHRFCSMSRMVQGIFCSAECLSILVFFHISLSLSGVVHICTFSVFVLHCLALLLCYFYHSHFFLFSFCSSSGCSTWICMALGRWLREPALGIGFWTAFYDSRPTNEEMVHTDRRGIRGKRLSHLFRCISSGVDFILWFMPLCPPFFSSSFSHVSFFLIKLFYSLICMKEHRHGLQGEREMT